MCDEDVYEDIDESTRYLSYIFAYDQDDIDENRKCSSYVFMCDQDVYEDIDESRRYQLQTQSQTNSVSEHIAQKFMTASASQLTLEASVARTGEIHCRRSPKQAPRASTKHRRS